MPNELKYTWGESFVNTLGKKMGDFYIFLRSMGDPKGCRCKLFSATSFSFG